MASITQQSSTSSVALGKQRSYQEIVEFLDRQWQVNKLDRSLERIKKLDAALGTPSKHINAILVAGTNGKSLTIHFMAKLLTAEGFNVGIFSSPHLLTYNERFAINQEAITHKLFTDLANDVINTAETAGIQANTSELLTMIALLYFKQHNVDVALLEVSESTESDPVAICAPKVLAITRVTDDERLPWQQTATDIIKELTNLVRSGTWVVSADQSKAHLQHIEEATVARQGSWAMPIRKLAQLSYPFEQLHGRCAALAERAAQLFVEKYHTSQATVIASSLLTRPKGQRGRPTLEAKRLSELNPRKTVEQFWKDELSTLSGKFQVLDKEKPTVLLDTASNLDAFKNVLLGIRLLNYQRPLKGLALVIGAHEDTLYSEEFLKTIRYFFKKMSGLVLLCPPAQTTQNALKRSSWDVEKINLELKNLKIKVRATASLSDALEQAKKSVDERHGLVVVTGSQAVVQEYWQNKGLKKL